MMLRKSVNTAVNDFNFSNSFFEKGLLIFGSHFFCIVNLKIHSEYKFKNNKYKKILD